MQSMSYIPTITNYTQLWWVPNVVVAHHKDGIEAVHLASGRTVCKVNIRPINEGYSFDSFIYIKLLSLPYFPISFVSFFDDDFLIRSTSFIFKKAASMLI